MKQSTVLHSTFFANVLDIARNTKKDANRLRHIKRLTSSPQKWHKFLCQRYTCAVDRVLIVDSTFSMEFIRRYERACPD